jgi:prepilin-type N-terminal cleavage/methylation domain-containing protein
MLSNKLGRRSGFSLVELLVSIAVMAIIGGAVLAALVSQAQLTASQNRNMVNSEEIRTVLTFMGDEIAMMGNRVANPIIDIAEPQELQFYSNIDNDEDNIIERIRYYISGVQLKREFAQWDPGAAAYVVVADDMLIENLRNTNGVVLAGGENPDFAFRYYSLNDTVPATTAAITSVEIRAGLDPQAHKTDLNGARVSAQNMVQRATIRNRTMF